MVDSFGWQSIFYLNVPIGLAALVIAARVVRESKNPQARGLDLPGQILAVAGLASLTYSLIEANNYGWGSARIVTLLVVAGVALAGFALWETRARNPMLQLSFFKNITFTGANIVGLLVNFGFFGILFFMALFMQNVQGFSADRGGRAPAAHHPGGHGRGHHRRPDRGSRRRPPADDRWACSSWALPSSCSRPCRPRRPTAPTGGSS